jgi:hypothetical protein
MQVLDESDASSGGMVLVRHRPMRAVVIAGSFGALLSVVPLFIAPGVDAARFATFVVLALASAALVFLGRGQRQRIPLVSKPSGLVWGDELLPPPAHVTLSGNGTEEPPAYQALVGWADGRQRVALERDEPGPLLRDACTLARRLGLALRPGWGLERHFSEAAFLEEWESLGGDSASAEAAPGAADLALWPVQQKVATLCLAGGAFVPVVTVILARSPDRAVTPGALELVLTALTALVGIVLGVLFLGLRRRIALAPQGIQSSLVFFGRVLGGPRTLGPKATRAFAVAPDQRFVRHILFRTSAGPVSIASDPEGAARWVAADAPSERLAPELPLVTSARYSRPDRPARLRS